MAQEKFIHGKHDDCKHDGLYSNRKRLQEAVYHQNNWEEEVDGLLFQPIGEVSRNKGYARRLSGELILGQETRIEGTSGEIGQVWNKELCLGTDK